MYGDTPETATAMATATSTADQMRAAFRDIADQAVKLFIPAPWGVAPAGGGFGKYDAEMHARLCRCKFLGLSDRASARACGVGEGTLKNWLEKYPRLKLEMQQAADLANAHAAVLLRGLMEGGGPTALQAIKFFLSTHSREYQPKQKIEVQVDQKETVRLIRQQLYGLEDGAQGAQAGTEPAGPPELPLLEAICGVDGDEEASATAAAGVEVAPVASKPPASGSNRRKTAEKRAKKVGKPIPEPWD